MSKTSEEYKAAARGLWGAGPRWYAPQHARFMAAGWRKLAMKGVEITGRQARQLAGLWDDPDERRVALARGVAYAADARTYLRRALAECDPKTRAAIEADAREDGVL